MARRMPEITDQPDLAAYNRRIFGAIAETQGRVAIPFSQLLNSPEPSTPGDCSTGLADHPLPPVVCAWAEAL